MEASGAGLAGQGGSDAGQAQQGDGAGAGNDFGAIQEQLNGTTESLEQLRNYLQSQPWAAQEAPPEQQQTDPLDGIDFGDVFGEPDPVEQPEVDPRRFAEQIQTLADRVAEQKMQPMQEQLKAMQEQQAERQFQQEAQNLIREFPELNDPQTAQVVMDQARAIADNIGNADLLRNIDFIRLVYMGGRAADAAQQEGNVPSAAQLEGAGGASPAGGQPVDLGDAIINGGGDERLGARVLPL